MSEVEVFTVDSTLADLASSINGEHQLVIAKLRQSLEHAITCGALLLDARRLVPAGQWEAWIRDNLECGKWTVTAYSRLAIHRDELLIPNGPITIDAGLRYLKELGVPPRPNPLILDVDVKQLRRLRSEGMSFQKIGEVMGVSRKTVMKRLDPSYHKKWNEQQSRSRRRTERARALLAAKERDAAVKRHGGSAAEAYALLRRCALVLDGAIADSNDFQESEAMRLALAATHKAEDEIVRALRIERTQ